MHDAAKISIVAVALVTGLLSGVASARADCQDPSGGIGVSRTVEIDASGGPIFGSFTKQAHEPSFLNPNEVVLTFDDGPMPWVTKSILDTLDKFCTKATFFSVGKMALAYPLMVREELARGHTVGSHTYTHPYNLGRMKLEKARDEIERGLAAVAMAAGQPIAPFFRFTGLSDSAALLGYLQTRGIATFTVDVVSNDSYIANKQKLIDHTLKEIAGAKGGIVLFHDIKTATAKALPDILTALKARGYTIVHMQPKSPAVPLPALMAEVAPKMAKLPAGAAAAAAVKETAAAAPPGEAPGHMDVTSIAPLPRDRGQSKAARTPEKAAAATLKASVTDHAVNAGGQKLDWTSHTTRPESPGVSPPVFVTAEPDRTAGWSAKIRSKPVAPALRRTSP